MARTTRMSEREPGEREDEDREGPPTPRTPEPPPAPPAREPPPTSPPQGRVLAVWPPAWGPMPPQAANARQLPDGVVALRDGIDPTL